MYCTALLVLLKLYDLDHISNSGHGHPASESAASAKVGSAPETRVGKFTNSGELNMGFTQPIKVPADAETLIKK